MKPDLKRWMKLVESEFVELIESEWQPVIDDNIPLPPAVRGTGAVLGSKFQPRLPLRSLQIGQSMFVPDWISEYKKLADRISRLSVNYSIRFAVRKRVESGVEGTRVWRIG